MDWPDIKGITPHIRSQAKRPVLIPLTETLWSKRVRKSVVQLVDDVAEVEVASPVKLKPEAVRIVAEAQGAKQMELEVFEFVKRKWF